MADGNDTPLFDEQDIEIVPAGKDSDKPLSGDILELPWDLYAFLVHGSKGIPAQPQKPTLSMWHDGVFWHLCLHERRAAMVTYTSNESLQEALNYLSKGLRRESLEWRYSRPRAGK
jgi:hypothetical protein